MKVTLTQHLVSSFPLKGLWIVREIDWPPFLGLPGPDDVLGFETEDDEIQEPVECTVYWPLSDGPMATIKLRDKDLIEPEMPLAEWAAINRKGWTVYD